MHASNPTSDRVPTTQVAEFLLSLFGDNGRLQLFVQKFYPDECADILAHQSPRALAYGIVGVLAPKGLIDDIFFEHLRHERSRRVVEIDKVAADWRASPPPAFARTRRVDLRTSPPQPYAQVSVEPWDRQAEAGTGETLAHGLTDLNGRCSIPWSFDVGEVALRVDWTLPETSPSRATLYLGPIKLDEGEHELVDVRMPSARLPRLTRLLVAARKRWPLVMGVVISLGLAGVAIVAVIQHRSPGPDDTLYIPPIAYTTGLLVDNESTFASRVLAVVANEIHRYDVSFELSAAFSNPPRGPQKLDTFYIESHEVSIARYTRYLASLDAKARELATPSQWQFQLDRDQQQRGGGKEASDRFLPVSSVSWEQASNFCKHHGGTLPNSTQWEVAARNLKPGASMVYGHLYPWGDTWNPDANTEETRFPGLMPICFGDKGDKTPVNEGPRQICDLGGNLHEWTTDPVQIKSDSTVVTRRLRGASWRSDGVILAMTYVNYIERSPDTQENTIGFRCVYKVREPGAASVGSLLESAGDEGTPYLVEIPEGVYHNLGLPDDPRLRRLARAGDGAEHILAPPIKHEDVGDFFIMKHKVTNHEYQQFLRSTDEGHGRWSTEQRIPKVYDHSVQSPGKPDWSVRGVSWYDAFSYCSYRGMRLPSIVEWERVVRGNKDILFPWGNDINDGLSFFRDSPESASHALVRDMWSDGPEWTLDEGSHSREGPTRVLKGRVSSANIALNSTDGFEMFLSTIQRLTPLNVKIEDATIRCVIDREPGLLERLAGWAPASRTQEVHLWPPIPPPPHEQESPVQDAETNTRPS